MSIDGMIGREALVVLFSQIVVAKLDEPISHLRGWINGWIAIAVTRLYSQMIRRARLTSTIY